VVFSAEKKPEILKTVPEIEGFVYCSARAYIRRLQVRDVKTFFFRRKRKEKNKHLQLNRMQQPPPAKKRNKKKKKQTNEERRRKELERVENINDARRENLSAQCAVESAEYSRGQFKKVYKGVYEEGLRYGQACVAKEFIDRVSYEAEFFAAELQVNKKGEKKVRIIETFFRW
jgi:hypothetical protein